MRESVLWAIVVFSWIVILSGWVTVGCAIVRLFRK